MCFKLILKKRLLVILTVYFVAGIVLGLSAQDVGKIRDMTKVGPKTEGIDFDLYEKVLYVSIDRGSDQNSRGTKNKPLKTLSFALLKLDNSISKERCAVLLSAGTYAEATIKLIEFVDLFGGFCPTTWKRDIYKYQTILDGKNVRRVLIGADHARIDGFTITHGLGRSHGGGILCEDSSPIISNNFITDNFVLEPENFNHHHIHQQGFHGGGIASMYNAVPVIRNNIICNNKTSIGNGGGMAFYGWVRIKGAPEPVVRENILTGGLRALVENNVIVGNIAGVNDIHRTRSSNGGAISCAYEARPIIRNNVITGNEARGRGDGGGIYCEYYSSPRIETNWIIGNIADDDGGGIYTMRLGQPLIVKNIIAGNWTRGGGVGGIRLSKEGRSRIVDNLIVNNQSGGGIQCVDSYMELERNTIMHNRGGSALTYVMNFTYFIPSTVRDNIMHENEEGAIHIEKNAGQPMRIEGNNVEGGYEQGKGNFGKTPGFPDDSIQGRVVSSQFNASHYSTNLILDKPVAESNQLAGRVLYVGERWGVIKKAQGKQITIWGDVTSPNNQTEFEIIPSYHNR